MRCASGEDDSFETGFGLAASRSEFFVEDFESGAADSSGVGQESDLSGGMLLFEALQRLVDLLRQSGVGGAERKDFCGGELPGVVTRMRRVDPVVG